MSVRDRIFSAWMNVLHKVAANVSPQSDSLAERECNIIGYSDVVLLDVICKTEHLSEIDWASRCWPATFSVSNEPFDDDLCSTLVGVMIRNKPV